MAKKSISKYLLEGAQAGWGIVHEEVDNVMDYVFMVLGALILGAIAAIAAGLIWGFPVALWVNTGNLLLVTFVLLVVGSRAENFSWTMIVGFFAGSMSDKDKSQAAISAIPVYAQIIGYTLLSYAFVLVAASFLPIKQVPWLVPALILLALMLTFAGVLLGGGKEYARWSFKIALTMIVGSVVVGLAMFAAEKSEASNSSRSIETRAVQLPSSVTVPACSEGWSDPLPLINTYLDWPKKWPVQYEMTDDGNIVQGNQIGQTIANKADYPAGESIIFCTENASYVGRKLPLLWKAKK